MLDLFPCPSRSVVSSSRLVMRLGRRRPGGVMCLLDLSPMAFSSRSYRLVGRDGERGEATRFRSLFHDIFMYSESIAVNIGHLVYIAIYEECGYP